MPGKIIRDEGDPPSDICLCGLIDPGLCSKNNGKGYWMDSRLQFFTNIKTAFDRNFGDKK